MPKIFHQSCCKNLLIASSTVGDGNMSFKRGRREDIIGNRKKFLAKLHLDPARCVLMNLCGGVKIGKVNDRDLREGILSDDFISAEALITKSKNLFLAVLTADCAPIVLFEPKSGIVSVTHASKSNTDRKFTQKVIDYLAKYFSLKPQSIRAFIGPTIEKKSYVFDELPRLKSDWGKFCLREKGKFYLDIVGYNLSQMKEKGLRGENINFSGVDTFDSKDFFSHRRSLAENLPKGRFLTIAGFM